MSGLDDTGLFRVYFDDAEIAPYGHRYAGYPLAWFEGRDGNDPVKVIVREAAGFRCERCGHPYPPGIQKTCPRGEWTPCDELCAHGGPVMLDGPGDEWAGEGPDPEQRAQWRILTTHHLNGVKADLRWWNLAALCQRCHLAIQGKVLLERTWPWEHSEWFKPHAAGYYQATYAETLDEPELPRLEVLASMAEILALHNTLGKLPA